MPRVRRQKDSVHRYVGVVPHWIFKHIIGAAGCPVIFLRPVSRADGRNIVAAHIEISSEILAVVHAGGRHRCSDAGAGPSAYYASRSAGSFNSANTASFDNAEPCASNSLA
jgi:hypothetical protein